MGGWGGDAGNRDRIFRLAGQISYSIMVLSQRHDFAPNTVSTQMAKKIRIPELTPLIFSALSSLKARVYRLNADQMHHLTQSVIIPKIAGACQ